MEPMEVVHEEIPDGEPALEMVVPPLRRVPNLLHFLLFLALTVFSLVVAEALLLLCAKGPLIDRLGNAKLQLGVELLGYVVTLVVAWFAFGAIWERPFLTGLAWNWAAVKPRLIVVGFGLGFLSQAIETLLPVPKHAPIEDLFRSPGVIWFLAGFGTVFAPLFEEILFRGLLLPGLAHAIDWMGLPKDIEVMERWRGMAAGIGGYSRLALVGSSLVTSLVFAGIHAPQIGYTWSAVALLAGVSMVLCWIRVRYDSVAASTVVHGCYNLSVFVTIFIGTQGFRHLDKAV